MATIQINKRWKYYCIVCGDRIINRQKNAEYCKPCSRKVKIEQDRICSANYRKRKKNGDVSTNQDSERY